MPKKDTNRPQQDLSGRLTETTTSTKRRYKNDLESGEVTDVYVSSSDPSVKTEYYFARDLSLGTKNSERKIRIEFQSLEVEENTELLHILESRIKS